MDTPTHTLQTTLNETFEKKFKSYLAATISGDDTSKLSEREKYRIIDMIYADTMLHLLVLHTTDTIGKTWADGKHYKSSAFVFGIKKDKTIQSLCLLNDLYMEHGAMADSNGYILAFINFKTDAESKDFMWKGDICRIPPDMGDYSVCSVFEDTLNGGFYPYFIGDTVVHFNFAGRYVFENDRKASLPVNNILSGKQRAVEHMKNYAMAVVAHSNGFIKNNIDDNNYSDMFAKIKKWASR